MVTWWFDTFVTRNHVIGLTADVPEMVMMSPTLSRPSVQQDGTIVASIGGVATSAGAASSSTGATAATAAIVPSALTNCLRFMP